MPFASDSPLVETPVKEIKSVHERLCKSFRTNRTIPVAFRKEQLHKLVQAMSFHEEEWVTAMSKDLKTRHEALFEVKLTIDAAISAINNLDSWVKPQRVSTSSLAFMADTLKIQRDPLGLVLIISPWNYPLILLSKPLVGAIAGGNCVIMKPSEISSHTAMAMANIFSKYLDPECFSVVNGGVSQATALLDLPFDHICYTGSGRVAKIVMEKAAKHLTPVTLELGGKSPTIVTKHCDFKNAANRIISGKTINSGQTCIAPDYILCDESVLDQLVEQLKASLIRFYGNDPAKYENYGCVITENFTKRLKDMLDKSKCDVLFGGEVRVNERFFQPTLVKAKDMNSPIMQEEIFGPILPIVTYKEIDEVISFVNSRDKPLVMYIFSTEKREADRIIKNTSSGAVLVNDTVVHFVAPLPFGGVGASGMGSYGGAGGRQSFETFTHAKPVLYRAAGLEFLNEWIRYPPISDRNYVNSLKLLMYSPAQREVRTGRYFGRIMRFLWRMYDICLSLLAAAFSKSKKRD